MHGMAFPGTNDFHKTYGQILVFFLLLLLLLFLLSLLLFQKQKKKMQTFRIPILDTGALPTVESTVFKRRPLFRREINTNKRNVKERQ